VLTEGPPSHRRDLDGGSGSKKRENLPHLDVASLVEFLQVAIEVTRGQAQKALELGKPDFAVKEKEKADGETRGVGDQLLAFEELPWYFFSTLLLSFSALGVGVKQKFLGSAILISLLAGVMIFVVSMGELALSNPNFVCLGWRGVCQ